MALYHFAVEADTIPDDVSRDNLGTTSNTPLTSSSVQALPLLDESSSVLSASAELEYRES